MKLHYYKTHLFDDTDYIRTVPQTIQSVPDNVSGDPDPLNPFCKVVAPYKLTYLYLSYCLNSCVVL